MTDIKVVIKLLEEVLSDRGVPRNVKESVEESIRILKGKDSDQMKIATVVSVLDESSNDPNISPHTRTRIWNIVTTLESMKS